MSRPRLDAVVVGSGPNGLAAAIELARAGRSVRVYEARDTVGGGTRSAVLNDDGVVHDVCSAIHPLLLASPFFTEVGLDTLGIEVVHPEVPLAHPVPGGAVALHVSVAETAAGLGADGGAYEALMHPLVATAAQVLPDILGPAVRVPRHPLLLLRFVWNAVRAADATAVRRFRTEEARGLFAGLAAHSMLPMNVAPSAGVAILLALLAHHVGWPLVRGGSQRIADGMTAYLEGLGGEVVTGTEVTTLGELPPARAYLCDVSPRALLRLAGDRFPARYRRRLQRFRYGPGIFKVDWSLSAPVPWTADLCRRAGTVHLGWSLADIARSEAQANAGTDPEQPFILLAQQSVFDETRAPQGKHNLWGYCHVGSGSENDLTESLEARIEEFAPGFRDVVTARSVRTARDYETYNPNFVGGDINSGLQDVVQHIARPALRFPPYSTPARDVFLCSSSTPPGGGVHGVCGMLAARAALRRVF